MSSGTVGPASVGGVHVFTHVAYQVPFELENPCVPVVVLGPVAHRAVAVRFGGIVALNSKLDAATAAKALEIFTEVVIAPDADEEAVALFRKKKNVRLLVTGGLPDPLAAGETFKSVSGGFLVQSRDTARLLPADLKVVTQRAPSPAELRAMLFGWRVVKHLKSNAIVYVGADAADGSGRTLGVGAGQMSRVDSSRIAVWKAGEAGLGLQGSVVCSDAFFPFRDGVDAAAAAGIRAVVQPGGSVRDAEVIDAANEHDMAMIFTGRRVFRHWRGRCRAPFP